MVPLTPHEIVELMECGAELEARGHGEEAERGRYTRIIVNVGTHRYEGEGEEEEDSPLMIEGEKPKPN